MRYFFSFEKCSNQFLIEKWLFLCVELNFSMKMKCQKRICWYLTKILKFERQLPLWFMRISSNLLQRIQILVPNVFFSFKTGRWSFFPTYIISFFFVLFNSEQGIICNTNEKTIGFYRRAHSTSRSSSLCCWRSLGEGNISSCM
jgi:hypothetical protein